MKSDTGARRVTNVVNDQTQRLPLFMPFKMLKAPDCTLKAAGFAAGGPLCQTALTSIHAAQAMSQAQPIQLFVTHDWTNSDDYLRVFEYLESSNNFFYKNCSTPDHMPAGDKEALRESLRKQIAPAEVVIALPSLAEGARDLLQFQMVFAQACNKPVVLMKNFGSAAPVPKALTDMASELVDWDGRALVDAIKRQARHEETNRWETIEFKLD
jgi:hypothetical protein